MEYNDPEDQKFWDAMRDKDYTQAIYHISPRLYHMYLQAGQVTQEERAALEAQMRQSLSVFFTGFVPMPEGALWMLEKWFGFGKFRQTFPSAFSDRAEALARLDAQKVAVVTAILQATDVELADKVQIALGVARIDPDSDMGWGACQALAHETAPYAFSFQSALQEWCSAMYAWFKHSALGGMH